MSISPVQLGPVSQLTTKPPAPPQAKTVPVQNDNDGDSDAGQISDPTKGQALNVSA